MRAMFDKLPNFIDPIVSVQHNKCFAVSVNQGLFPRLVEQTLSQENDVEISIEFYYDKVLKFPAYRMQLKTILVLECQRSLTAFNYPVEVEIEGVFIESLALAEEVPDNVEIYELEGETISLMDLVEDELLLQIPLSPINPSTKMDYDFQADEIELEAEKEEFETKPNPFAALKGLKTTN